MAIERTPGEGVAHAVPGKACAYDVVVKQADVKVTGTGKTFINAIVEDTTGRIECIQWDPTDQDVVTFTQNDVVQVKGKCGTYKDKPQLTVAAVYPLSPEAVDWGHVLPTSPCDYQWMCNKLDEIIGRTTVDGLREILHALLFTPDFTHLPAATFMHHAYVHGLMEHSLSVTMNAMHYSAIGEGRTGGWDLDIVIAGALLHDVGKVHEYAMTGKHLEAGKTLGHSLMGCEMFSMAAMTVEIDPRVSDAVRHVIASHHARPEWGAVVEPKTSEAWLVHCMDLADSRMFATSKRVG